MVPSGSTGLRSKETVGPTDRGDDGPFLDRKTSGLSRTDDEFKRLYLTNFQIEEVHRNSQSNLTNAVKIGNISVSFHVGMVNDEVVENWWST